ncbi:MAG: hypothetical protein LUQ09_07695 [Methanomassiliicoccales archaeon]|nr:hypothetical protein [Methanomassiliicoccales archaeon]
MNKKDLDNNCTNKPDNVNKTVKNQNLYKTRINEEQKRKIKETAQTFIQSGEINETELIKKIKNQLDFCRGKDSTIRNYLNELNENGSIHSIKKGKLKSWLPGTKKEVIENQLIIDYSKNLLIKISTVTNYADYTPNAKNYIPLIGEIKSLEKQERIRFHRPWVMWVRNIHPSRMEEEKSIIELRTMNKALDFETKYMKKSYFVKIDDITDFDMKILLEMDMEEMEEFAYLSWDDKSILMLEFVGYAQRYLSEKIKAA